MKESQRVRLPTAYATCVTYVYSGCIHAKFAELKMRALIKLYAHRSPTVLQ